MQKRKAGGFKALLLKSNELASNIEDDEVPAIHRTIAQLNTASRKTARVEPYADVKAQMFLSKSGLDLGHTTQLLRSIDQVDLLHAFKAAEAAQEADVDRYIDNQQHALLVATADEVAFLIEAAARRQYFADVSAEWQLEQQQKMDAFNDLSDDLF